MTKQSIISILKDISSSFSSSYSKFDERSVLMFNANNDKPFSIEIKGGIIYCNCVRIDNTKLIDFINDGKIIAILKCSAIEKIGILDIL